MGASRVAVSVSGRIRVLAVGGDVGIMLWALLHLQVTPGVRVKSEGLLSVVQVRLGG